jgi:hypothetical protein
MGVFTCALSGHARPPPRVTHVVVCALPTLALPAGFSPKVLGLCSPLPTCQPSPASLHAFPALDQSILKSAAVTVSCLQLIVCGVLFRFALPAGVRTEAYTATYLTTVTRIAAHCNVASQKGQAAPFALQDS